MGLGVLVFNKKKYFSLRLSYEIGEESSWRSKNAFSDMMSLGVNLLSKVWV